MNILQEELEARERLAPEAKFSSEPNSQLRRFPAQSKKNMSTESALFAFGKRKSLVSCTYCKQSHSLHNSVKCLKHHNEKAFPQAGWTLFCLLEQKTCGKSVLFKFKVFGLF